MTDSMVRSPPHLKQRCPLSTTNLQNGLQTSLGSSSSVFVLRARGLATMAGVEPARSTFVASSPKSLGPWSLVGCSPGCRAQPLPLIWQLSRAYKARPHTGADYKQIGCGGWTCTTTGRFMRPVHRYLCYATERWKTLDGPSATATGVCCFTRPLHRLARAR